MSLALVLLAVNPVQAQQNGYVARVRKVTTDIKVDGRLNEPTWAEIEPITEFTQTEPDEGNPATERTGVRIFYDNRNLYFGFRCFDSEPEKIIARARRSRCANVLRQRGHPARPVS